MKSERFYTPSQRNQYHPFCLGSTSETCTPDCSGGAFANCEANAVAAGTYAASINGLMLATLKQANLLFDAKAWELLRRVNGHVKEQMKFAPELEPMFRLLLEFMSRGARSGGQTPQEPTEG